MIQRIAGVAWNLCLIIVYTITGAIKSMIPLRLHTKKDISREIVLITGAGKCLVLVHYMYSK